MLKMFSKRPKIVEHIYANDLVGCIGKVPIHREFVKHRVTSAEIANLDQWYQSAFHAANRELNGDFKKLFSCMPSYSFIYTSPATQQPLIGSIYPSHDLSGRCYPCVFFRSIENPVAHEFQVLIPVLYQDYYSSVDEAFNVAKSDIDLPDFFEKVNRLNQTVSMLSRKQALQMAIDALHEMKVKDFIVSDLDKIMTAALSIILRNNQQGIRFPLGHGKSYIPSIIFWLQILDVLVADKSSRWQLFWHKTALIVYFKPIAPACFSHLLIPGCEAVGLIDVMREASRLEKAAVPVSKICANSELSLMQLSQRLTNQKFLNEYGSGFLPPQE